MPPDRRHARHTLRRIHHAHQCTQPDQGYRRRSEEGRDHRRMSASISATAIVTSSSPRSRRDLGIKAGRGHRVLKPRSWIAVEFDMARSDEASCAALTAPLSLGCEAGRTRARKLDRADLADRRHGNASAARIADASSAHAAGARPEGRHLRRLREFKPRRRPASTPSACRPAPGSTWCRTGISSSRRPSAASPIATASARP